MANLTFCHGNKADASGHWLRLSYLFQKQRTQLLWPEKFHRSGMDGKY